MSNIAEGTGVGVWATAYGKARDFVTNLTAEEKVNLTAGITTNSACSGIIPALPRVGFPGMCVTDAGNGVVCRHHFSLIIRPLIVFREARTTSTPGQVGFMLGRGISFFHYSCL